MSFTTNYCRNPSFQMAMQGYSSLLDAAAALDKTNVLYGNQSLFVNCPGLRAGEGCVTDGGIIPGHATCSASVFITGSGSVIVYALTNPGNVVVGSIPVTLTGQWQRVQLTGIQCTPGQTLFLEIATASSFPAQFWISGVQIEDTSPCHPYCDGDQDGCDWIENFWGGVSVCHFENPVHSVSASTTASNLVPILAVGEKFFVSAISSSKNFDSLVLMGGVGPAASVTDFSVCQLTDPDPAQTYTSWNNAGTTATTGNAYTRIWSVFYPPQQYLVSNGQVLYQQAAYMAAGWFFASVPNNGTVNMTRIQTEILPVTTGYSQPAPTAFDPPRAIHTTIKPNRLNFCTNPSIEGSTINWSAIGSASLSQDSSTSVGEIIEYDDNLKSAGNNSLNVVINANGDGAQITVPDLITGRTYIASLYVQAGLGLENIIMSIANGNASVLSAGGTGYGAGGYGEGPYGGINPMSDLALNTWFRINCIFTATSDSHILEVISSAATDVSYPTNMWVDAVLVEAGELLSFYFDGNFGQNYSWETSSNAYAKLGVLMFSYPNPLTSFWDVVAAAPNQTGFGVANVNSGPGTTVDSNYTAGIAVMNTAKIPVAGYVQTSSGSLSVSSVQSQIQLWNSLYGVQSIFFDGVSSELAEVNYYQSLYQYVKNANPNALVILNPGTIPDQSYMTANDIVVVFEGTGTQFSSFTPASWMSGYEPNRFAVIVNSITSSGVMQTAVNQAISQGIGYVFITNDSTYATLPSYYSTEISYLAGIQNTQNPQASRSYFYDQQTLKQQAVINILDRHTPLGILADTPKYSVPYTQ